MSNSENIQQQQLQSALSVVAQLQQEMANLKRENHKLNEQNQQLKMKNEEIQPQLRIVEVLRKQAKFDIQEDADDTAVLKSIDECKFPLLTDKIDLSSGGVITNISLERLVAACPHVIEISLNFSVGLDDAGLTHLPSLKRLRSLELNGSDLTDQGVCDHLAALENLERLKIFRCELLTDAALEHIAKLTKLVELDLRGCENVGDVAGLRFLGGMKNLAKLHIGSGKVTDNAVQALTALENLTKISFADSCNITDLSLQHLSTIKNLREITFWGCVKITNKGIGFLTQFESLTALNLWYCPKISDAAFEEISEMINLTTLGVCGCDLITDTALQHLAKTNITDINIYDCAKLSAEAKKKLKEALPKRENDD